MKRKQSDKYVVIFEKEKKDFIKIVIIILKELKMEIKLKYKTRITYK